MTNLVRIALYALVLAISTGCFSYSEESGYRESATQKIVQGVTSKSEVLDLLGPPSIYSHRDGILQFQYERKEKRVSPIIEELSGYISDADSEALIIDIDSRSEKVISVERRKSK